MHIATLHPWNLTPAEAIKLQRELAARTVPSPALPWASVKLLAGVDVSSQRFSPLLTAGIVVLRSDTFEIVEQVSAQDNELMPYIPGLLSFRELPVIVQALQKLKTIPDVFLVDGQGQAHPRRLGIAAHLGLLIEQPTIGVAKSILTGWHTEINPAAGSTTPLRDKKEVIGEVVCTKKNVKPVYVSIGNHIDLASSVDIVLHATHGYRLPEPTRRAHLYVNEVRKQALVDNNAKKS